MLTNQTSFRLKREMSFFRSREDEEKEEFKSLITRDIIMLCVLFSYIVYVSVCYFFIVPEIYGDVDDSFRVQIFWLSVVSLSMYFISVLSLLYNINCPMNCISLILLSLSLTCDILINISMETIIGLFYGYKALVFLSFVSSVLLKGLIILHEIYLMIYSTDSDS